MQYNAFDGRVFGLGVEEVNNSIESVNLFWKRRMKTVLASENCLSQTDQQSAFASCKCQRLDKTSGLQSCGHKLHHSIHRTPDNWSRTIWRVDDWRQQNQGATKAIYLPPILFCLDRDRTWEPTWKEDFLTSVFFHLFWTRQFTAILGVWRTVDIRRTKMRRSLQKNHKRQLRGNICCETPFQRKSQTPGWLVTSSEKKTMEPNLPKAETTRYLQQI